jgi:DNA-binding NtrC family response regulator
VSTNDDIALPDGLRRLRQLDPRLAEELTGDFTRLSRAAGAVAWAQRQLGPLLAAPTEAAVLAAVVSAVRGLTGAPRVWALTWSGDLSRGQASFETVAGDGVALGAPPAVSRTVLGRVSANQRPAWTDDAQEDARFLAAESVQAFALRSVGCVPLGPRGVIWLEDPDQPGRFDAAVRLRVGALCAVAGRVLGRTGASPAAPAAPPPPAVEPVPGLVGQAPTMHALYSRIRAFAPMPWPALVLGETGTGKEAIARALHALSPRSEAPFVPVNCGAIVDSLAESTLFGHERGAFTGADRRKEGVLAQVKQGTLFLDEVGELSPALQVKLLRVLQEGAYQRLGGRETLQFSGRIVAATHRGLDDPASRGSFREDLFYRLAAGIIRVPPLRERRGDIPALANHLLARAAGEFVGEGRAPILGPATLHELEGRAWSGNVRELENSLRGALALCIAREGSTVEVSDLGVARPAPIAATAAAPPATQLPANPRPTQPPAAPPAPAAPTWPTDLKAATEAFQRMRIEAALDRNRGNRSAAARELGVSRQWLHRLMARWTDADEQET